MDNHAIPAIYCVKKSKRKYYAQTPDGSHAKVRRGYMVRWYCDSEERVLAAGPYENEELAHKNLHEAGE